MVAAIALMHFAFRQVELRELIAVWSRLSLWQLAIALVLTLCSYSVLSVFDFFALREANYRIPYRKILRTSFLAYCFNFNFGVLIGAVGLRYRLYGKLGVKAGDITRVMVYATSASLIGYGLVAGMAFVSVPLRIPAGGLLPDLDLRLLGILILIVSVAYLLACSMERHVIRVFRWRYELPDLRGAGVQIGIACTQWMLASAILFSVLPAESGVTFLQLLAAHLIAAVAGVVTHVPAGYGVLEGTMLVLLATKASPQVLLGGIVAYRAVYHLLPLIAAVLILAMVEHRGIRKMNK
jgi:uncharacterized membrane protein YbhN (UPF0104 family)